MKILNILKLILVVKLFFLLRRQLTKFYFSYFSLSILIHFLLFLLLYRRTISPTGGTNFIKRDSTSYLLSQFRSNLFQSAASGRTRPHFFPNRFIDSSRNFQDYGLNAAIHLLTMFECSEKASTWLPRLCVLPLDYCFTNISPCYHILYTLL